MKYAAIALACLLGLSYGQEQPPEGEKAPEEGKPEEAQPAEGEEEGETKKEPTVKPPEDPAKVLSDLLLANAAKDVPRIDEAAQAILAWAKGAKDEVKVEEFGKELSDSLKLAKGNHGTLNNIMMALGELRSKVGSKTLKKYATKKEAKDEQEEKLQATAILGLGKLADPKEIATFEEISKSRSTNVAKAAYEALGFYGPAKAKVRKQCAEVLMKRLDMEFPSSGGGGGGGGGGGVSAEKQERWNELSPTLIASMKSICREATINDIENWREWWKENKKKPWKDEDES
jgi:hypothetical protein